MWPTPYPRQPAAPVWPVFKEKKKSRNYRFRDFFYRKAALRGREGGLRGGKEECSAPGIPEQIFCQNCSPLGLSQAGGEAQGVAVGAF